MNRSIRNLITLVAGCLLTSSVLAEPSAKGKASKSPSPTSQAVVQPQAVNFTNKLVDGKKTWLPATVTVKAGSPLVITLINTLTEPHGFEIADLLAPVVVPPGETMEVKVVAKAPGRHKFSCQLHPAHVGGELVVEK